MSLNPLNVLKRKLEDDTIPLPKRLRLAKNVLHTHHFPAAPKERIVAEWLEGNLRENTLNSEEFRNVLGWLNSIDGATSELKSKLIELTAQYLQINTLQDNDVPSIIAFIENSKITPLLSSHIAEYCFFIKTLLKHLQTDLTEQNIDRAKTIFNGLIKYYKESKKKLDLVDKILDGDNFETILDYLDHTECRDIVLNVCQTILFPMSKKSFFTLYLRTLLQKESTEELMEEKGDNIQAVLKTMDAFFTFPNGRTSTDKDFLKRFIEAFVNSFKTDSQLIFAFYIMVTNSLNIAQNYINPVMKMPSIVFEENNEKIKRALFLNMLQFLLENEVDLTTRLTETLSGNKGHIKKNFTSFLQAVIMTQIKLEGKPDKTTLQIIITSLKLDPILVESKLDKILPPLMVVKKSEKLSESYVTMINCLLEMLFKLSRGSIFINQLLPHLKTELEAIEDEQIAIQKNAKNIKDHGEKVPSKLVVGTDLLPEKCVEMYGKLTSELMFRQNTELLLSLQKDFEDYCLVKLEDGDYSHSTSTLAQLLAAILSTFFERSKMADHTVPQQIAEEFWTLFGNFEKEVLGRFGDCLLKADYDHLLSRAFLKLSLSYAQLKLLNLKYSHVKVTLPLIEGTLPVFDLHFLLPCLSSEQWTQLCQRAQEFEDELVVTNLLILKTAAVELLSLQNPDYDSQELNRATKTHLIKNTNRGLCKNIDHFKTGLNSMFPKVVFANLDAQQLRLLSKSLIAEPEMLLRPQTDTLVLELDSIASNKPLLNALTMATLKTMSSGLEDTMNIYMTNKKYPRLSKALAKDTFEISDFLAETTNVQEFFGFLSERRDIEINKCNYLAYLEILHQLQLPHLDEKYQLSAILVLLALKSATDAKKIQRKIDELLQSVFEISPKHPDLYKLFPIEYLFDFEGQYMIKLLTLNIKTSNPLLLIKCLLETAVKKVKTNAEVVRIIVKILLTNQKVKKEDSTNIEYFSDIVFQISCLILPIIAKEKKVITNSAFRTILAELQEKLHKALLKSFKSINLHNEKCQFLQKSGNTVDSETVIGNTMATLDAMEAFSLTLSKYCETTDAEDIKNLDYLWSGLEFFFENAVTSIQDRESKPHHIDASIHLLNVALRNIKKLENHPVFQNRDKALIKIWQAIKARLQIVFEEKCVMNQKRVNDSCLEDIGVTVKFVSELASVDGFVGNFIGDLFNLMILKKPSTKRQDEINLLTSHLAAKYLWTACLKANLIEKKCLAMAKTISRTCKNSSQWLRQHYEQRERSGEELQVVPIDENVCEVLKIDLDVLADVILAAKKIPLNYKFLDAIFETQHLTQSVMGLKSLRVRCEVSWQSYFKLFEGSINVLNSLLMSREELLEDRWPCYMQCYRALIASLCQKSSTQMQLDRQLEEKLAVLGHSMEKLTQSISKRKAHISRLAAYAVADICAWIEKTSPSKLVRQHLENSVAYLIQVSDSSYAMAFLRRGLAGAPGQMTMTNMYAMYKRYHKYVGNA